MSFSSIWASIKGILSLLDVFNIFSNMFKLIVDVFKKLFDGLFGLLNSLLKLLNILIDFLKKELDLLLVVLKERVERWKNKKPEENNEQHKE